MYSSIEENARSEVIDKCYWPLLRLADIAPIGIEAPAITLEIIEKLDPEWINTLKDLVARSKVEFIGSGYSQIIGPLVPALVNDWNQKIGLQIYGELLNVRPKVALINEMAYSGCIVEHYINHGYDSIIMEWNNPRAGHPEWENEWRYHQQNAIGTDDRNISLIWADSIAFQKFQRFAHGEYELGEYVTYIKSHVNEQDRYFPLYSNDIEIFDYRPGRYHTEAEIRNPSEWGRIYNLFKYLSSQKWCELILPSDVLNSKKSTDSGHKLKLESPAQPIPVKKQEKYNINRWALTGRDDIGINTKCYQIYNSILEMNDSSISDWKELCYLWSSDFRTHIVKKRWLKYINRMNVALESSCASSNSVSHFAVPRENKKFDVVESDTELVIESNTQKIIFNKIKGMSIKSFIFKKFSNIPLFGTLDHGYYDDISLGADYYTGHAVIERPGEHKVTDLNIVYPNTYQSNSSIRLKSKQKCNDYTFKNTTRIGTESIIFEKSIRISSSEKSIIRPFSITFNPEAWDRESLFVKTNNGGKSPEKFYLAKQYIAHGDIYSSLISARHGFGNTERLFIVGDKDKALSFKCDMSVSALIPAIIYKEMINTYFFRLQYSAREIDETSLIEVPNITLLSISISSYD